MKSVVLDTCRIMLKPVARLLLRAGIGFREFAEIGKQVFVDVARQDYGLQGRPTNSARVALMTGLSRREVARIRQVLAGETPGSSRSRSRSRLSAVLTGWHVDSDFIDPSGRPRVLPREGEGASLSALLDRYAGDIPHGALVKELEQLGLIGSDADGFRVLARDYIREQADPDLLRQGGQALHDHAGTILHNLATDRSGSPRFERMATEVEMQRGDAAAFEVFLAEKGQEFLEQMDRWLAARKAAASCDTAGSGKVRTGVGMYLIFDEE